MFRTATGQTGTDAYLNEAAAIANAQRALDARAARLAATMAAEMPDDTVVQWSIATAQFPDATMPSDAKHLRRVLQLMGRGSQAGALLDLARCMADPSRVFTHGDNN